MVNVRGRPGMLNIRRRTYIFRARLSDLCACEARPKYTMIVQHYLPVWGEPKRYHLRHSLLGVQYNLQNYVSTLSQL